MKTLPLPLRIAAGLVATAVDQARDLPRLVVEFPVTAVSQALQVTMRMQQKVTELAIKGDRALGTLRPVEEKPSWATFDDDEPPRRNGASTVTALRPQAPRTPTPIPVAQPPARKPAAPKPVAKLPSPPAPSPPPTLRAGKAKPAAAKPTAAKSAEAKPTPAKSADAKPAAAQPTPAKSADAKPAAAQPTAAQPGPAQPAAPKPAAAQPAAAQSAAPTTPAAAAPAPTGTAAAPAAAAAATTNGTSDAPAAMPGYPDLTIPQLRGKLRFLSAADLTALLDWETAHGNRATYRTMLGNRIATVTES